MGPRVQNLRPRTPAGSFRAGASNELLQKNLMSITETVLEMHYHQPLMELFQSTYGLGAAGKFNFYKYSPQREVFLGFDQAYAMTELSDADFFSLLKTSATTQNYKLQSRFVAYFLQFKVVSEMQKRSKVTPLPIKSKPHYRSTLDTAKNDNTGFSQHELLYALSKNDGAMVYYACPMLWEKPDLYKAVDLETLRLVELDSCPSAFTDHSKHHIYFDQPSAGPIWCSEPVNGRAINPRQMAERIVAQARQLSPAESIGQLEKLLSSINARMPDESKGKGLAMVADSLTIVQLD